MPLAQLGQRLLFLESRRRHIKPVTKAPQEPDLDPFPEVELVGLFGSGTDAGVILRHRNEVSRIRVGAEWTGWRLKAVNTVAVGAVFASAGRADHEIRIKRQPQRGRMIAELEPPAAKPASPPYTEAETRVNASDAVLGKQGARSAVSEAVMHAIQERPVAREAAREVTRQVRKLRANR